LKVNLGGETNVTKRS